MGYRAHVIKQHRDYGSAAFTDWDRFQVYVSALRDRYETAENISTDDIYENEQEDFYEIPKNIIEAEIKRLEELDPEAKEESLDEEVKYVLQSLRAMLEQAPKDDNYVALEWY